VYNALAAVASFIHTRPDEARELLTDFADFTRYAFRRQGPYVTLADELHYVEKYLRSRTPSATASRRDAAAWSRSWATTWARTCA
jgi:hypothetical protein